MAPCEPRSRGAVAPAVLAILLLEAVLVWWPPSLFTSIDYVYLWKPTFRFFSESLRAGRLPSWNPYIGLGRPFLADIQNALFYPPTYLIAAGERLGVLLLLWLHGCLAFLAMRALARRLGAHDLQALAAGGAFLLAGGLTSRLAAGHLLYVCALDFVPLIFLLCLDLEGDEKLLPAGKLAAALALQFLCGHPQASWLTVLGVALFLAGRASRLPLADSLRPGLKTFAGLALALAWCAALAGIALVPFYGLVRQGNRGPADAAFADFVHLDRATAAALFTSSRVDWERDLFIGLGLFLPGWLGLLRLRGANARGLGVLCVGGLVLAAGADTPLFSFLLAHLPGFGSFRMHARVAFLASFALILLAALWLSSDERDTRAPGLRWAAGTALAAVAAGYWFLPEAGRVLSPLATLDIALAVAACCAGVVSARGRRSSWMAPAMAALFAIQGLELLAHACGRRSLSGFERVLRQPPTHPETERAAAILRAGGLLRGGQPPPRVAARPQTIPWNDAMVYRFSTFDAYTSLFLKRPWDYLHGVAEVPPHPLKNTTLMPTIYAKGPFPYRDLDLALGYDADKKDFVLRADPPPRAFIVHQAQTGLPYAAVLAALAKGHDVHRSALLEAAPDLRLSGSPAVAGERASIRRFDTDRIVVDVDAKEDGLLVLLEAWYPGWKATVDGKVVDALAANLWMRAYPVPAGTRQMEVFYRQEGLAAGAALSAGAWALLALAWRRRRSPVSTARET